MLASVLALVLGGLLFSVMGNDEDDTSEADDQSATASDSDTGDDGPEQMLGDPVTESGDDTLGVTVEETADAVAITVDDATPGNVLALTVADETTDDAGVPVEAFSLRLYLAPDGATFPEDPSGAAFASDATDTLAEWEVALGLTELEAIDLGDGTDAAPEVTANRAVETLFLESTDGVIDATSAELSEEDAVVAAALLAQVPGVDVGMTLA